jgi:signal transduction histidine kinase
MYMKPILLPFIPAGIVLIAGAALSFYLWRIPVEYKVDMTALDNIEALVTEHWGDSAAVAASWFDYEFVVFDNQGICLFQTNTTVPTTIRDALQLGYITLSLEKGGIPLGTAMINTKPLSPVSNLRQQFVGILLAGFIALALALGASFLMMYHIIRKTRADIQTLDKSKREQVADISYDIKTQVNAIRLIAELSQAGSTDTKLAEKLKAIETKAAHIETLTAKLR